MESRQGIQSVEVAGPLLRALANAPGPIALSLLAKAAGMPAAKAHRYLVSLIRVGLVQQDGASGHYDLGTLALELGLVSLGRLDAIRLADQALAELRDATGETVALATWGNMGPTYVRLLPSRRALTINLQIGNVLPLTYTATGLCFAAYLPDSETAEILQAELTHNRQQQSDAPQDAAELLPLLAQTRAHGLARMIGRLDPSHARDQFTNRIAERLLAGFNAFAAPVFNHLGQMQFALTLVGAAVHVSEQWDGPIANATRAQAEQLSRRLGYRPEVG
ncbi:IclR family transcriptional regulator [Undibacterium arcticum]|uniref:IclR family transcriptional regulator n=1 Tax=Undibacterium arcticum TaxID=1762892 RepID=A0ABV7F244_9BURK